MSNKDFIYDQDFDLIVPSFLLEEDEDFNNLRKFIEEIEIMESNIEKNYIIF